AVRPRNDQRPHAGGSRQHVLGHSRAHPPDRGQGASQAEAPEPVEGSQNLPRELIASGFAATGEAQRRGPNAVTAEGRDTGTDVSWWTHSGNRAADFAVLHNPLIQGRARVYSLGLNGQAHEAARVHHVTPQPWAKMRGMQCQNSLQPHFRSYL